MRKRFMRIFCTQVVPHLTPDTWNTSVSWTSISWKAFQLLCWKKDGIGMPSTEDLETGTHLASFFVEVWILHIKKEHFQTNKEQEGAKGSTSIFESSEKSYRPQWPMRLQQLSLSLLRTCTFDTPPKIPYVCVCVRSVTQSQLLKTNDPMYAGRLPSFAMSG